MSELLTSVRKYVRKEYSKPIWEEFAYHNLAHTEHVVSEVKELCELSEVEGENADLIEIAAWFHDLGYANNSDNHEKAGVEIAKNFLSDFKISQQHLDTIEGLILATSIQYFEYDSLGKKIIKDADLSNAGLRGFVKMSNLLRKEWSNLTDQTFSNKDWYDLQVNYLSKLTYLSTAGEEKYNEKKEWHLDKFIEKSKNV